MTTNPAQPLPPPGRTFEMVPRVLRCACENQNRAVVFFHSSDNPYGNPKGVWAKCANRDVEGKRERFYGIANKLQSARFPKFNEKVHVVEHEMIPKQGTNRLIVDPADRNFFMTWFRHTEDAIYVYREWPGDEFIEGVGVPGPWAVPDGKKPDGRPGPAQKAYGWGLPRYKEEIARLEGWKDFKDGKEKVIDWDQWNGSEDNVRERFIDSRWAGAVKIGTEEKAETTLMMLANIGLPFNPTMGTGNASISEGVQMINDVLDYDEETRPKLYVSSRCRNTIFALSTWTGLTDEGKENTRGATKDPIDNLRYYFLAGCDYVGPGDLESVGGGHYR